VAQRAKPHFYVYRLLFQAQICGAVPRNLIFALCKANLMLLILTTAEKYINEINLFVFCRDQRNVDLAGGDIIAEIPEEFFASRSAFGRRI
jgi:hypothetical protein